MRRSAGAGNPYFTLPHRGAGSEDPIPGGAETIWTDRSLGSTVSLWSHTPPEGNAGGNLSPSSIRRS
eukprot:1016069-Pyramimonas_sp.AAC.1